MSKASTPVDYGRKTTGKGISLPALLLQAIDDAVHDHNADHPLLERQTRSSWIRIAVREHLARGTRQRTRRRARD